jgi:hypothetical protein
VHTPPERFREYLTYLKENQFRCIAMRDLEPFISRDHLPDDPLLKARHPPRSAEKLLWPVEITATRREPAYWLKNMLVDHGFTLGEAAGVFGWSAEEVQQQAEALHINRGTAPDKPIAVKLRLLPYPGGREVRLEFFANLDWQRGTKASVFTPWDPTSYVVVDLPEAIFFQHGLLYLAHTHIPTIWDKANVVITNVDWTREPDGSLRHERVLPNKIAFGASMQPKDGAVDMQLWLHNGSAEKLTGLRVQVCGHLKGAPDFNSQTKTNKLFRRPFAAVRSAGGDRWIITAWERCGAVWGSPLVPCIHADPVFSDCSPGETVRVRGRMWFYEGKDLDPELERTKAAFP